jgi:Glutathione S-transferase, N-terminal domain
MIVVRTAGERSPFDFQLDIVLTRVTTMSSRKVAIVLEELGLTYETIYLQFQNKEHKAPEFTRYNPNGRIPAIIDHKNNDYVLWCVLSLTSTEVITSC